MTSPLGHLEKLYGATSMSCGRQGSDSNPFVSVIVPVYNDPLRLETCLRALEEQTYPRDSYEVIVVDNGSDESIEHVVAGFSQAMASYESRPGSYAARNRGLSLSVGEILAFTDSDCIPAPDWIKKGVEILSKHPNHKVVGGRVEFLFEAPDLPTATELYDSMIHLDTKRYIEQEGFTATANLFTYRSIFDHIGYFDADLRSSGDREWGQRATSLGFRPIYADDVLVAHPARYSFAQLREKTVRLVLGYKGMKKKRCSTGKKLNIASLRSLLPPLITLTRLGLSRKVPAIDHIKILLFCLALHSVKMRELFRIRLLGY